MIPSSPNATSLTALASFTTVMISSDFSAISFGVSTVMAPCFTKFSTLSLVLLKTIT